MIKIGIISASTIVKRFLGAINLVDGLEVVAIASQSGKAKELAKEFNISKVYDTYDKLYQDQDVDLVYVANINDQHFTCIMDALSHDKHVICEKPFVLRPEEVIEAFDLAKSKGKFLMECQKSVFLPVTRHLKNIIDTNELGKLKKVTMNNSYSGRIPKGHWMNDRHQGGVWIPSGSYIIEYLNHLLGDFPKETNYLITRFEEKAIYDIVLNMRFGDDIMVQASLTARVQTDDISKFYFEKGFVEIYQSWKARKLKLTLYDDQENPNIYEYPCEHELVYELEHIKENISEGKISSDVMTKEVTYKCVKLVDDIQNEKRV